MTGGKLLKGLLWAVAIAGTVLLSIVVLMVTESDPNDAIVQDGLTDRFVEMYLGENGSLPTWGFVTIRCRATSPISGLSEELFSRALVTDKCWETIWHYLDKEYVIVRAVPELNSVTSDVFIEYLLKRRL